MARESEAKKVRQLFLQANSPTRARWREKRGVDYDFWLNDQLTKNQLDELSAAGMPDHIINMILPIISVMKYFLTANNPRWNAIGADGSDTNVAFVHSSLNEYSWYISSGRQVYSQVIDDCLVKSAGWFFLDIDPNADRGMGEVMYDFIDPWDVYVDPTSKDIFCRDANFIQIKKNLTKSSMAQKLPKYKKKIMAASGEMDSESYSLRDQDASDTILPEDITSGINAEDGKEEDKLPYYETYRKVQIPFVRIFIKTPPTAKEWQQIKQGIDVEIKEMERELSVQLEEKKKELAIALEKEEVIEERVNLELERAVKMMQTSLTEKRQLLESKARDRASQIDDKIVLKEEYDKLKEDATIANNIVFTKEFFEPRIKKTSVFGDTFLYEEMKDIDTHLAIRLPYLHTGTPYSIGAVTPLVGKQKEINKSHQITIHNANLGSNLRWLYQQGQIDTQWWEKYSSSSGALLPWNDVSGNGVPPQPIMPQQLNNAFFSLTENGKVDMEYISGIHSTMQGDPGKQTETYRGMLANDEFGTRRLRSWINNVLEPCLEHVGKTYQQLAQKHYDYHKVWRIVQPNADGSNRVEKGEINIPIYSDLGEAIGKFKDYASARFDTRIVPGSTMPVNRWALLEEYFKWYQADLIDDIAMLAETDIKDKEAIVKRKSIYAQLKNRVAELEEALKNRQGDIEQLEGQILQGKIDVKASAMGSEMRKSIEQTKAGFQVAEIAVKQEADYQKKKLRDDTKQVQDKVKSKSEKK